MWSARFLFQSALSAKPLQITSRNFSGHQISSAYTESCLFLTPSCHTCKPQFQKISTFARLLCKEQEGNELPDAETEDGSASKHKKVTLHPPETSIRYLESKAYKDTYGNDPVWKNYRRNYKGQFLPRRTRARCIRGGLISTGSPCPLCRDEYLVVHHTNAKLLEQFVSPYTGEVLSANLTGVCRRKQFELDLAILKARDLGLISFEVPFRYYNYEEYYPQLKKTENAASSA